MDKVNNSPEEILKVIKGSKRVLTCMDSRFDYDSLCSILLFNTLLKSLNIEYEVYYEERLPQQAKNLLPESSFIVENTNASSVDYSKYDLMVLLDTGNLNHISKNLDFEPPDSTIKLAIDHHEGNILYGNFNYVDKKACSTVRVLHDLFKIWNIEISKTTAKYILLGITTDSGFFQYNKTTASDLRICADMIDLGVSMFDLIQAVTFNESLKVMQFKALIYSNIRVNYQEKYAYSFYQRAELDKLGLTDEEKQVTSSDLIKRLENIDYVFVVKDNGPEEGFSISLRSHNMAFDVLRIAKQINGGGHKVAAGGKITGVKTIEEAAQIVINLAKQAAVTK